jgi:hypothetical protein
MDNQDKQSFKKLFDDMAGYYDKPELSQGVLGIYFAALERFSIEQVRHAANKHIQDDKHGPFFPKVANIVFHLEGGGITNDGIIAAARLKQTPLGILCCIQIGTMSLASGDSFHLRQRAEECLQLLPEWKARALSGDYTDHEISIMIKHDVDPCQPFTIGLARPTSTPALRSRLEAIKDTPRHKFLLARPYIGENDKDIKQAKNVAEFVAIEMMKGEKE